MSEGKGKSIEEQVAWLKEHYADDPQQLTFAIAITTGKIRGDRTPVDDHGKPLPPPGAARSKGEANATRHHEG